MTPAQSFNLADMFESVADTIPERTALVSTQRRLSYGELDLIPLCAALNGSCICTVFLGMAPTLTVKSSVAP
jgi:hypothetical protein